MRAVKPLTITATITAALLSACGQGNQYVAPPPPKVTVATPMQKPVTRYLEATGNLSSVNSADLVARVAGFVQSVNYQDGVRVAKGTLLFIIEPEPYRQKLEQAKAAATGAEANLKQQQATLQRQIDLLSQPTQANYGRRWRPRLRPGHSGSGPEQRSWPRLITTSRLPRSTASSGAADIRGAASAAPRRHECWRRVQQDPIYVN